MNPDLAVEEHQLRSNLAIWKSIHEFGLSYIFRNPSDITVSLVCEFYAGWHPNEEEELVPIQGRLIDIFTSALYAYLGETDVMHDTLGNFIAQPTYQEIRHALCDVNYVSSWVCDKRIHRHIILPKKKMK